MMATINFFIRSRSATGEGGIGKQLQTHRKKAMADRKMMMTHNFTSLIHHS
jgi:hypothetical protein